MLEVFPFTPNLCFSLLLPFPASTRPSYALRLYNQLSSHLLVCMSSMSGPVVGERLRHGPLSTQPGVSYSWK